VVADAEPPANVVVPPVDGSDEAVVADPVATVVGAKVGTVDVAPLPPPLPADVVGTAVVAAGATGGDDEWEDVPQPASPTTATMIKLRAPIPACGCLMGRSSHPAPGPPVDVDDRGQRGGRASPEREVSEREV
jgi:hypothetical protein